LTLRRNAWMFLARGGSPYACSALPTMGSNQKIRLVMGEWNGGEFKPEESLAIPVTAAPLTASEVVGQLKIAGSLLKRKSSVTFVDEANSKVGELDWNSRGLHFTGNADESARLFIQAMAHQLGWPEKPAPAAEPRQIWAKASFSTRCSLLTSTGPLWVGLDTTTGAVLGSRRWDIPAGMQDLVELFKTLQRDAFMADVRFARAQNKSDEHLCYAIPSILLYGAETADKRGQFGMVLDNALARTLKDIGPTEMEWITTASRRRLHEARKELDLAHTLRLVDAITREGISVTVHPGGESLRFDAKTLKEVSEHGETTDTDKAGEHGV